MSKSKKAASLLSNLIVRKGEAKASPFTPAGATGSFGAVTQPRPAPDLTPDPTPAAAVVAQAEPEPVYEEPEQAYVEPEPEPEPVYEEPEPEPEPVYEEPEAAYEEPEPVYEEPEAVYEEPEPAPQPRAAAPPRAPAAPPQAAAPQDSGAVGDLARITKAMRSKPEPEPEPQPQQTQASVDFASAREAKSGKRPFGPSAGNKAEPKAAGEPQATGKRTAHTLRLDAERHLKLKVYSVFTRVTIQKVLTDALDDYLERVAPQSVPGWHRLNEDGA